MLQKSDSRTCIIYVKQEQQTVSTENAVLGALDAGGGALPRLSMAPADPSFSLQRIHKGSLRLPAAGTCLFKELVRKKKDQGHIQRIF